MTGNLNAARLFEEDFSITMTLLILAGNRVSSKRCFRTLATRPEVALHPRWIEISELDGLSNPHGGSRSPIEDSPWRSSMA